MVRSLIIRQVFRVLDFVLVIAVIAAGTLAVKQYLSPLPTIEIDPVLLEPLAVETDALVKTPGERALYDGLIKSGMFGTAGRWDPKAAPKEAESDPEPELSISDDIADSELNLTLKGTIALEPDNPFSVAFIENGESKDPSKRISFMIGQEVIDNVFLELVYAREVVLINKRKEPPQRERLRMEDKMQSNTPTAEKEQVASSGRPQPPQARSTGAGPSSGPLETITLDREELYNEVAENSQALMQLQPKFVQNEKGDVIGVTVDNISKQPLAQKLGFHDNDVVQTVNNEKVDSQEKIMDLMMKYQNASSFRVGIMRGGKPHIMNFRLN